MRRHENLTPTVSDLDGGRIAVFVPTLAGGGAEQVILRLAGAFHRRGYPVDLVVLKADGELYRRVPASLRLVELGARRVLHSVPALLRYLYREKPVVLLSTLNTANVVAAVTSRFAPKRTRVVIRQAAHLTQDLSARSKVIGTLEGLLVRWCYPLADAMVAVSNGVADDLAGCLKIPRARVGVIPNPVVTPELTRLAQAPIEHPWFESSGIPVVLGAGRLVRQKRFDVLIRAFARVVQTRESRLIILGEGEERPHLQGLIRAFDLESVVSLHGFVDNPLAYMSRASLFVLSSDYEGLPGALIEALACGIPVVATDCESGPREILQDGRVGRLVPVGDIAALAEAICAALSEPLVRPPLDACLRYEESAGVDAYLAILLARCNG
jgi:glycosyltransferase involved in cell wall biosynthesis